MSKHPVLFMYSSGASQKLRLLRFGKQSVCLLVVVADLENIRVLEDAIGANDRQPSAKRVTFEI
eukprot:919973-Amphidinium_carterae.1